MFPKYLCKKTSSDAKLVHEDILLKFWSRLCIRGITLLL